MDERADGDERRRNLSVASCVFPGMVQTLTPAHAPPAGGGRPSFEEACAAEHVALLRFGFLLCGSATEAEDLVADALARVLPKWEAGRVASLGPYTRRVMVNRLKSGLRRRLLERRDAERQRGDRRGERAFDETVADHDQLRVALLGLPPQQRAAIVLRYFEDLREIEVAAVLGTSVGTVKAYVSRGLERLRTVVDER